MRKETTAKLVLLLTAMIWGSTFAISKLITDVFSASFIIASRFTIASMALTAFAYPLRNKLNKDYLIAGFFMGISLFASYLLQVVGLTMDTSPGKSAFLCTTYCVIVPFINWIVTKNKPKILHLICVVLSLTGVGILSLTGGSGMSSGDILTVLSGVPYALNIVICAIVCKDKDVVLLTTIELWVVAILAMIVVLATSSLPTTLPMQAVGAVIYLGLLATAACMYFQSYGLKYANPTIAGMLLSLESVFGVIFSILLYKETITFRMYIGFIVIFMAVLLSQKES